MKNNIFVALIKYIIILFHINQFFYYRNFFGFHINAFDNSCCVQSIIIFHNRNNSNLFWSVYFFANRSNMLFFDIQFRSVKETIISSSIIQSIVVNIFCWHDYSQFAVLIRPRSKVFLNPVFFFLLK